MIRALQLHQVPQESLQWMCEAIEISLADPDYEGMKMPLTRFRAYLAGDGRDDMPLSVSDYNSLVDYFKAYCDTTGEGYRHLTEFLLNCRAWDRFVSIDEYEAGNGSLDAHCYATLGIYECGFGEGHGGLHGSLEGNSNRMVWWETVRRVF